MEYATLISGLLAGMTYSLTAYWGKPGELFDWLKFGTSAVLGLLAGFGVALWGVSPEFGYNYLIALGATPLIQNLLKILWRRLFPAVGFVKPYRKPR